MNPENSAQAGTLDDATTPAPGGAAPRARLRRPEPARKAPHRHAATLLREAAPPAAPPAGSTDVPDDRTAAAQADEGPVALGVRLGYRVIEEQILLGQKLARRLGRKGSQAVGGGAAAPAPDASAGAAAGAGGGPHGAVAPGEVGELIDRVVHLYKDLGALCFDAVETLARNPVLRAGVARLAPGAAPAPAAHAEAVAGGGFALDIRCSRRTQVTLDLRQRGGVLLVHALHAADPAIPPLGGVRIEPAGPAGQPLLQLHIADTQPAATYTGVVVDGASNEPRGTLVVRVLPPGA